MPACLITRGWWRKERVLSPTQIINKCLSARSQARRHRARRTRRLSASDLPEKDRCAGGGRCSRASGAGGSGFFRAGSGSPCGNGRGGAERRGSRARPRDGGQGNTASGDDSRNDEPPIPVHGGRGLAPAGRPGDRRPTQDSGGGRRGRPAGGRASRGARDKRRNEEEQSTGGGASNSQRGQHASTRRRQPHQIHPLNPLNQTEGLIYAWSTPLRLYLEFYQLQSMRTIKVWRMR